MKTYFSREYIDFFNDLAKNNDIGWFEENRNRYEEYVKKPFYEFISDLIPQLNEIDPKVHPDPENAVYRIQRDTRFSRDKTPFYIMMRAGIIREGRRSGFAGYYLGIGAGTLLAGGGVFSNNSQRIRNIREIIAQNQEDFLNIVHSKEFIDYFGDMYTETSRRLSPKFAGLIPKIPEIARKQFYIMRKRESEELILSDKINEFFLETFKVVKPYNKFFNNALENYIMA